MIKNLYPNLYRVMTCKQCGIEQLAKTAGMTVEEVASKEASYLCYNCREGKTKMCSRCGKKVAMRGYATCGSCHETSLSEAESFYNVQ